MSEHVSYLNAKFELDDRAIDRSVLSAFEARLPAQPTILEVGAGTVTMPERLLEWGIVDSGRWIALDSHAAAIESGRNRLCSRPNAVETDDSVRLGALTVDPVVADAFEYVSGCEERFDAVVGNAFFDIVDAERAVSAISLVTDLVYAPITYDGKTAFEPADPDDRAVLRRYERHMREYRPGSPDGASALSAALSDVIVERPSPWRIEPPYADGERTIIEHLLETIEGAVAETGGDAGGWADRRREQIATERLRYEAANRDLLGRP